MVKAHPIVTTEAFVLKKKLWREYDLLLELYTQDLGFIRAISFGAASSKSIRGRQCDLFNHIKIQLKVSLNPQNNLKSYCLTDVLPEYNHQFINFQNKASEENQSYFATQVMIASAYYLNDCYRHLAIQIENVKQGFSLLMETLKSIDGLYLNNQGQLELNKTIRIFELQLFIFLGYDMRPSDTVIGDNKQWYFSLQEGWQSISSSHSNLISIDCLNSKQYNNIHEISTWCKQDLKDLQKHNRRLIDELSGHKIKQGKETISHLPK